MTRLLVPLGFMLALGLSGCPQILESISQQNPDSERVRNSTASTDRLPPSHIEPIPNDSKDETSQASPLPSEPLPVDTALSTFLGKESRTLQNTDFQAEYVDLNGDGYPEALVLLTDSYWCGMAGCNMVVFEGSADGYEMVSNTTLVHAPVWVSESQTNGWNDLIIHVSGGGITAQEVVLKYDGTAYPTNPSLQEAIAPGTPREAELFTANTARSVIQPIQPAQPVVNSSRDFNSDLKVTSPDIAIPVFPALCGNWQQVSSFETDNYWVSICRNARGLVYIGSEKVSPDHWIRLNNVTYDGRTYSARNSNITYAINAETLMVLQNGEAIATESVVRVRE